MLYYVQYISIFNLHALQIKNAKSAVHFFQTYKYKMYTAGLNAAEIISLGLIKLKISTDK